MIIAGGRDFRGTEQDFQNISDIIKQYNITEIVSGAQRTWDSVKREYYSADYFGEQCADRLGIPVKRFPADWEKHGRAAGPLRNAQMAEYTDYVYLLPGGTGTDSMRREAVKAGKIILWDGGRT